MSDSSTKAKRMATVPSATPFGERGNIARMPNATAQAIAKAKSAEPISPTMLLPCGTPLKSAMARKRTVRKGWNADIVLPSSGAYRLAMNPLRKLIEAGLPEMDTGVMRHGFADHGRDYIIILEDSLSNRPGTYQLTFTHVVELQFRTEVGPDVWKRSWSDDFTDYQRWEAAGEPDGYVFGTNWSLAYSGFSALEDDASAAEWASQVDHPMFAACLQTDRFHLTLVFHDARLERLGPKTGTVSQVIHPMI